LEPSEPQPARSLQNPLRKMITHAQFKFRPRSASDPDSCVAGAVAAAVKSGDSMEWSLQLTRARAFVTRPKIPPPARDSLMIVSTCLWVEHSAWPRRSRREWSSRRCAITMSGLPTSLRLVYARIVADVERVITITTTLGDVLALSPSCARLCSFSPQARA